jgi:heavy metal sensor kinase
MRFRPRYVRDRLTLWFVGVFGLVLGAYICGATFLLFWQLTSQLYSAEIQDVETSEGLLYFTPEGKLSIQDKYLNHPKDILLLNRLMEVLTPDGRILFQNERLGGETLGGEPFAGEGQSGYNERSIRLQDGTRVLVISHIHSIQGRPLLIRLAYSTEPITYRLAKFLALLLFSLPIALIVSAFAGYRVVGKILNPLEEMAGQTEQITANRLHDRVPVENPNDELGHMARVLNGLLQRLEESFEQLKRFTSDVSHELRTPLASIRSVGEVGLQKDHSAEGYRDIIGSMLEEVTSLTLMIDTLLTISRADAGQIELQKTVFPLMEIVREVLALISIMAEEKQQVLTVSGADTLCVNCDRTFLRIAIMNLVDNAVKYSPIGSRIRICIDHLPSNLPAPGLVELSIEDEGSGIVDQDRSKVFDRFYRVDESRTRDAGGSGLGLSIAKWAVEAEGGQISLRPANVGGSVFYIRLPIFNSAPR